VAAESRSRGSRVHRGEQNHDILSLVEHFADARLDSRSGIDLAGMLSIQHRERRSFLAVEQFVQHRDRFLVGAAGTFAGRCLYRPVAEVICGPVDTSSGSLAGPSSRCVSATSDAKNRTFLDEKAALGWFSVLQQEIYGLCPPLCWPELISTRFAWCPKVVVISRFVCIGSAETGFMVTSSGSCSECSPGSAPDPL